MGFHPRKLGPQRVNPLATFSGVLFFGLLLVAAVGGYLAYRWWRGDGQRTSMVWAYINDPEAHPDWVTRANSRCEGAPFAFPSDGYVGYLYGDSFKPLQRHTGIDIFGNEPVGKTKVYAAADGYLTRLADWKSAVIIRIPDDPLMPGREIWLYYAHMADAQGGLVHRRGLPAGDDGKAGWDGAAAWVPGELFRRCGQPDRPAPAFFDRARRRERRVPERDRYRQHAGPFAVFRDGA